MKLVFHCYPPGRTIPVLDYLKNKKLLKYFNRETAAAIVSVGTLLCGEKLSADTPFFYATGLLQHEDYGLTDVAAASTDRHGKFSQELFVAKGLSTISPLNQFKVLQNMPYSFVSIEFQLQGDNAVVYSSSYALLSCASASLWEGPMLVGAGKVRADGRVESGFVLGLRSELPRLMSPEDGEAIEIFRTLAKQGIRE